MQENGKVSLKFFFAISAIALLNALLAGCISSQGQSGTIQPTATIEASSTPSATSMVSATPTASPTVQATAENKSGADKIKETIAAALADGTYSGDETYAYHSGKETVTFSVTVKDGIVTAVSVTPHNPAAISARIIGKFSGALPGLVVGKRIDQLNIPHNVAGSSLTSAAFKLYVDSLLQKA